MVAPATAVVVVGSFELGRSSVFSEPELRSEHAQPGAGVPPEMMVVISTGGKIFHASGYPFIHDKAHIRTVVAREALGSTRRRLRAVHALHERVFARRSQFAPLPG
jgi:hypothetical protein